MMPFRIIVTTFLIVQCASVQGLQCYSCSDFDNYYSSCDNNQGNWHKIDCRVPNFCYIQVRGPYSNMKETIRGCWNNEMLINVTVPFGETQLTHYTACTTDLCNSGDGSPDHWFEDLQCYTCSVSGDEGAQSDCALNPQRNKDFLKTCRTGQNFCTITRSDPDDKLFFLKRGCAEVPEFSTTETTMDGPPPIHYTVCIDHFCNSGSGVVNVGEEEEKQEEEERPEEEEEPEEEAGERIQCYLCSDVDAHYYSTCKNNPEKWQKVDCRRPNYCNIQVKQSYAKMKETVRGCWDNEILINVTVPFGEAEITQYTACTADLCNSGDGSPDHWFEIWNTQKRTDLEKFHTLLASYGPGFTSELQKDLSQALQCYDCHSEDEETDCVVDPSRDPSSVVTCPHQYCSIRRTQKNGKFSSMRRLCEELPPYLNETASSGGSTVHYTSCTSDLCNSGDGAIEEVKDDDPDMQKETDLENVPKFLSGNELAFSPELQKDSKALQCYNCHSEEEESDCVRDPENNPTFAADCIHKYCTVRRTEKYGKFSSLWRLCEELPPYMNESVSSSSSTVHYTSCTSDLCNRGNGVIEETQDEGLRCYSCSSIGAEEKESACVTNPAELHNSLTRCSEGQEYCTITRGEIDGEFTALERGCSERPERINATAVNVVKGRLSRTYHFSCKSDLCNDGDGFIKDWENESLWCYECTSTNEDSLCVKNPAADESFLSPCPFQFCSIRRAETTEGQFQSLWRMCEDEPLVINETVTSGSTKVHYTSCDTNVCNDGDGNDGTAIAVPSTVVFAVCATIALHFGH